MQLDLRRKTGANDICDALDFRQRHIGLAGELD
jgi:hypothetical protein